MNPGRLSFALLIFLGSSVAEKKSPRANEFPEDEVFWGIRGLMGGLSMSMAIEDCELDVSLITIDSVVEIVSMRKTHMCVGTDFRDVPGYCRPGCRRRTL